MLTTRVPLKDRQYRLTFVPVNNLRLLITRSFLKVQNHRLSGSLLSLILPSCMIAPNRGLANTLFRFTTDIPSNSRIATQEYHLQQYQWILKQIYIHRGRLTSASPNSSRESSMSFMAYMNRVQALASSLA